MSKKKRKKSGKSNQIQIIKEEMWDGEKIILVKKVIKHRKPI